MEGFTEWHLVNLVLPAMLPLAFALVVWFFPLKDDEHRRANPWAVVKDGQLAWVALGMCTAGIYEIRHPTVAVAPPSGWESVNSRRRALCSPFLFLATWRARGQPRNRPTAGGLWSDAG
jgi:hypothetical protein